MSACIGREDLMNLPRGSIAITGAGHLIGCAAALAAIRFTEEKNLCKNAETVGNTLLLGMKGLMDKYEIIGDVRGKGLLVGVELVKSRTGKEPATGEIVKINRIAYENGLLTAYDGLRGNVFRFMPALTISEEEVKLAIEILDKSFTSFLK